MRRARLLIPLGAFLLGLTCSIHARGDVDVPAPPNMPEHPSTCVGLTTKTGQVCVYKVFSCDDGLWDVLLCAHKRGLPPSMEPKPLPPHDPSKDPLL